MSFDHSILQCLQCCYIVSGKLQIGYLLAVVPYFALFLMILHHLNRYYDMVYKVFPRFVPHLSDPNDVFNKPCRLSQKSCVYTEIKLDICGFCLLIK